MRILGRVCLAFLVLAYCPRADAHGGACGGHFGGWGGHYGGWGGYGHRGFYGYGPFYGGVGLGLGLGYYGSYYSSPYYPYPYYPAYGAAPPVVVQSAPVASQGYSPQYPSASPVSPPQSPEQVPPPKPLSPSATISSATAGDLTQAMATMPAGNGRSVDIEALLRHSRSPHEQERADALVQLGRLKVERAVGPLVKALNEDGSPSVREAAARGLGLLGAPWALVALERAALGDADREVRHSASFAAEVIRGSLQR